MDLYRPIRNFMLECKNGYNIKRFFTSVFIFYTVYARKMKLIGKTQRSQLKIKNLFLVWGKLTITGKYHITVFKQMLSVHF